MAATKLFPSERELNKELYQFLNEAAGEEHSADEGRLFEEPALGWRVLTAIYMDRMGLHEQAEHEFRSLHSDESLRDWERAYLAAWLGWSMWKRADNEAQFVATRELALRALDLGPDQPLAMALDGLTSIELGEAKKGRELLERSTGLFQKDNPLVGEVASALANVAHSENDILETLHWMRVARDSSAPDTVVATWYALAKVSDDSRVLSFVLDFEDTVFPIHYEASSSKVLRLESNAIWETPSEDLQGKGIWLHSLDPEPILDTNPQSVFRWAFGATFCLLILYGSNSPPLAALSMKQHFDDTPLLRSRSRARGERACPGEASFAAVWLTVAPPDSVEILPVVYTTLVITGISAYFKRPSLTAANPQTVFVQMDSRDPLIRIPAPDPDEKENAERFIELIKIMVRARN